MKRWSVTCLSVGLLGLALPGAASAAERCSDANSALGPKLALSAAERQALTIRRVCVDGGGVVLRVTLTFGGDISAVLGTGHLSRAAVGIAAFGPPAKRKGGKRKRGKHKRHKRGHAAKRKGKRKPRRPAGPTALLVLGTTGAGAAAHTVKTSGLGDGAEVVRNGSTLDFWIADRRVASIKRLVVALAVLPVKGRKTTAHAASAEDDALYAKILDGAYREGVSISFGGATSTGEQRCKVLEALISIALAKSGALGPWLAAAQALYKKLCGGGATFGGGDVATQGSTLTSPADTSEQEPEDTDVWDELYRYCRDHPYFPICTGRPPPAPGSSPTALRGAALRDGTMPASGQILAIRLKGSAIQAPGDLAGPLTQIHFSVLRPQADGSVKVIVTSQPFNIPVGGDPNQVTTYNPTNLCAAAGDYLALSTEGGFDPVFYPKGVPYQVLAKVPGSQIRSYSKHNGVMNGAQFTGTPTADQELLMQWDLGTGNKGTALCPGGTKGGAGGG
jgi:hypothetical protein